MVTSRDMASLVYRMVLASIFLGFGALCNPLYAQPEEGSNAQEEAADDFSDDGEFEEFSEEFSDSGEENVITARDPLEGYNRVMFKFNDKFYFWLVRPAAKGYRFIFPRFFRTGVSKAFTNVKFPLRFLSSIFQFKFKKAGNELGRFVVNSTVGIGGLFDPAVKMGLEAVDEDFGQMMGAWGVGDGFPVVIPFLGQSNLRDGFGLVLGIGASPFTYLLPTEMNLAVSSGEIFNRASLHIGEYESIKKEALDPYTFIRDAYKQNRDKRIQE